MIHHGDCIDWLKTLPESSVHTCVTSPPYFGLRSYLAKDDPLKVCEIGSEPTPEEFVATMVRVFGEVRRVLRDDGVLFLNLGDGFCSTDKWGGGGGNNGKHVRDANGNVPSWAVRERKKPTPGLKPGDLLNIPYRVASALQADGWWWRQTVIWYKASPMPESVSGVRWVRCMVKVSDPLPTAGKRRGDHSTWHLNRQTTDVSDYVPCPGCPRCIPNDGWVLRRGRWRPTTGHEYLFMMTKGERYFCDGEAMKELSVKHSSGNKHRRGNHQGNGNAFGTSVPWEGEQRNPRTVQAFAPESFKGAHFATFPSSIPHWCIRAGTSEKGCCPTCGACWAPMVEKQRVATRPGNDTKVGRVSDKETSPYNGHSGMIVGNRDPQRHIATTRVVGWRPTCGCPEAEPVPCTVMDQFAGSGTTLQVAQWMGRNWLGCDLDARNIPMAMERIATKPRCLLTKRERQAKRQDEGVTLW